MRVCHGRNISKLLMNQVKAVAQCRKSLVSLLGKDKDSLMNKYIFYKISTKFIVNFIVNSLLMNFYKIHC